MVRIGILGAARIAPAAVIEPASRRRDVEVVAVASRRPGAAEAFAHHHGIARAYSSYRDMLADPDIDLIYNALPPAEHARQSIAAVESGKHVLCEKPFAMNAREAEVMIRAAEQAGRRLIEAFHYRYHPLMGELLSALSVDAVGRIVEIDAEFSAAIPFSPNELRHQPELGGGALMDLGCYAVHWVRSVSGGEPEVARAQGTQTALGVDETMEAELVLPGGGVARIRTNMAEGTPFAARLKVIGETGYYEIDNPVLPHKGHAMRANLSGVEYEKTVGGGTTYDYQLDAVLRALKNSEPVPTEGADSLKNMQLIDQIYEKAGFDLRF